VKLLVTGGCGFIGSHVAEMAVREGYEVAALDNDCARKPPSCLTYVADLRNTRSLRSVFNSWRPDFVSHHAAHVDAPGSLRNPDAHFENNVIGSTHLIKLCQEFGVKRIVFASSGPAIYGETGEAPVREDKLPEPETPYGAGKLSVEHLLRCMYSHGAPPSTILRYPNVYGPRQLATGVVGVFMRAALRGEPLKVFSGHEEGSDNSGCVRQYCYVEDIARINLLALKQTVGCHTYNVFGSAASTAFLAERIIQLTESTSQIECAPHRKGDIVQSLINADLLHADFKIDDYTPLFTGLMKTRDWWTNEAQSWLLR